MERSHSSTTRATAGRALRALQPLYGTDVLLAVLFGLTIGDISVFVLGRQVSIGDILLIPVLLILIMSPQRTRLPPSFLLFSLAYLLWATLALGWSEDLGNSIPVLMQYIEFFFLVPLAFIHVRNLRGLVAIMNFFVLLVSSLSVMVIAYAVMMETYSYVYFLNYQKNLLGAVTGKAIPLIVGLLLLSGGPRKRYWFALAVTSAAVLFSSSRGAMIGVIVGMAVFFLLIRRVRYGFVMAGLGTAAVFAYLRWLDPTAAEPLRDLSRGSSAGSRWLIYDHALKFITESPFIGHGVGSYYIEIPTIGFRQRDPSNLILLNLAEVGIVGLTLFLALLLVIARVMIRNARIFANDPLFAVLSASLSAAFVTHLAHIQVDVSWVRGTGFYTFACVGMLLRLEHLRKQSLGIGSQVTSLLGNSASRPAPAKGGSG